MLARWEMHQPIDSTPDPDDSTGLRVFAQQLRGVPGRRDCARLALLEEALAEQRVLFRMKHLAGVVLVREDLAKALEAGGTVGTKIVELEEFTGS